MTYKVKMTDEAASQLQDTAQYILRLSGSPSVSRKWMEKLQKAIKSLDFIPFKFPLVDEEPWKSEEVRKMTVDNFLVYYWVDETQKIVWVIAVVYGRRDQLNALRNIP